MTDEEPNSATPYDFDRELEKMLSEAEVTVVELRKELDLRKRAAQHAEIDRLEEHMAAAQIRWSEVRVFLEQMLAELRVRNESKEDR